MALTKDDAREALDLALNTFGPFLPVGAKDAILKRAIDEIFVILPALEFQKYFDLYWGDFFKLHFSKVIPTCPAFTTPDDSLAVRMVYVKDDGLTKKYTFHHEMIHFLQHPKFYPLFYEVGGKNTSVLEGVTELFTREMDIHIANERLTDKKYQDYLNQVNAWIGGDPGKRDQLLQYSFKGAKVDLSGLGATAPVGA